MNDSTWATMHPPLVLSQHYVDGLMFLAVLCIGLMLFAVHRGSRK